MAEGACEHCGQVATLMFIHETGRQYPDGRIEWWEHWETPHMGADRTRILRRDSEHPTGEDGWKIVPSGLTTEWGQGIVYRYCWNDIRAYGSADA